jgi:hypothetical protein
MPKPINLKEKTGANPEREDVSKLAADQVQWHNLTDRGHTILFSDWPFSEPWQPIMIPAKDKSSVFTVYKDASNGLYSYSIEPPINPPSGPPGEPGILVGD